MSTDIILILIVQYRIIFKCQMISLCALFGLLLLILLNLSLVSCWYIWTELLNGFSHCCTHDVDDSSNYHITLCIITISDLILGYPTILIVNIDGILHLLWNCWLIPIYVKIYNGKHGCPDRAMQWSPSGGKN